MNTAANIRTYTVVIIPQYDLVLGDNRMLNQYILFEYYIAQTSISAAIPIVRLL